ncbi:MAG: hypothetical protein OEM02_13425 [Desulfobulbaceae bacterium]|nr:hypothetical protein [Desulfobulbaceae bacterium]
MSKNSKMILKNCWEINRCERHTSGKKVHELGECIASKEGMGHSCWAIAGTLCGDEVQGSVGKKHTSCSKCEVYNLYHRTAGTHGQLIKEIFPAENTKYRQIILDKIHQISGINNNNSLSTS